jgi:hypothetical protein
MPYKRVDPVPVSMMVNNEYLGHFSICQKLRDIYQMTENEEIKLNCRIAMAMAKNMQKKLKKYKDLMSNVTNQT